MHTNIETTAIGTLLREGALYEMLTKLGQWAAFLPGQAPPKESIETYIGALFYRMGRAMLEREAAFCGVLDTLVTDLPEGDALRLVLAFAIRNGDTAETLQGVRVFEVLNKRFHKPSSSLASHSSKLNPIVRRAKGRSARERRLVEQRRWNHR